MLDGYKIMNSIININTIKNLINSQFTEFSNLEIKEFEFSGHDNYTFRLGNNMSIRLPKKKKYEQSIINESIYLSKIQSELSFQIPYQIKLGKPCEYYDLHWSINKWINGKSLNQYKKDDLNLTEIAKDLANFLNELHKIDRQDSIIPSQDNFYRGGDLSVYNDEMIDVLSKISKKNYRDKIEKVQTDALNADTSNIKTWIHGDFATGNILLKDNKVSGIIDFGQMAVGDFSCGLDIAWNFFDEKSCEIFLSNVKNITNNHILKAKGWAMWKAVCWPLGGVEEGKKVVNNILFDRKN